MKRTQTAPSLPAPKKPKLTAENPNVPDAGTATSSSLNVSPNTGSTDDGGWTKVEKRKAKKAKKYDVKLDATSARFMYATGEIQRRRDAVGIADVRDLILHLVADAPPQGWLRVENPRSVQKVVALLIPGLTHDLLGLPPLPTSATSNPNLPLSVPPASTPGALPFINATFSHACPTRAPGDTFRMHSIMSEFFQVPVTGEEKKRRLAERLTLERSAGKDPTRYMLSVEDMVENDYPVPSYLADTFELPSGWVQTPESSQSSILDTSPKVAPKILAVDCEMCLTEDGNSLARACIIEYATGVVIYDQLVKPEKPILDYLTRWSGITAEALEPVTTRHSTVQSHILGLLSEEPTPILLGHSLESDLKALRISHPRCIDTALLYHHPRGRPLKPGLAWLTKKWCGRVIQNRGDGGHDPEEDARACIELLKKKVENGPGFGEFKTDFESIFARMGRARGGTVKSIVVDHGNPGMMHGAKASAAVPCTTDEEVLQGLLDAVSGGRNQFVFGRFTDVAEAAGWITAKPSPDAPAPTPTPGDSAAPSLPAQPDLAPIFEALNTRLTTLHAALPPRTALVVFTGHSDPRPMAALAQRKSGFDQAVRMGIDPRELGEDKRWTAADVRELEEAVERAKRGLLFLCVKDK